MFIRYFQPFSPYLFSPGGGYSSKAITTTDTTSYVKVNEIYNVDTKTVNSDNFKILLKYITGNASATLDTVDTLATAVTDASEMRAFPLSAGSEGGISYSAKSNTQDICVRLGGLDWQVIYLSKDKSGNSILTLWLDNNYQDAWVGRAATEGEYYGFINGGLYSDWAANWGSSSFSVMYPSGMYGTSYIHAVTLNNGGCYSVNSTTLNTAVQKNTSAFALYTMEEFGLTKYLTTPRNVPWQVLGQNTQVMSGETYCCPNENLDDGVLEGDKSQFANSQSMLTNPYYSSWGDSFLWLPSLSEVGINIPRPGMWKTSKWQRQNYDGSTATLEGTLGSANSGNVKTYSWSRSCSAQYAEHIWFNYPEGNTSGSSTCNVSRAVRPALHLNLSTISKTISSVSTGELYNTSTKAIDKNQLNVLTRYISGSSSATSSTIDTLASSVLDASGIRNASISAGATGGVSYVKKDPGQDVTVRLGGLDWQVMYLSKDKSGNSILTLWLDGIQQSSWSSRSGTEGAYYGFSDGIMYSDYSANWSSPSQGNYPSNMYGTSYINAVTLNNGGSYATSNSAVTTATQSSSSVFAPFTMSSYGLTQYLVKPRNVAWQENQSAKDIEHVSFNYPNDAWSTSTSNDGFYSTPNGVSNYASKTSSDKWADSYLWLPSATEVGYANDATGLWKSSTIQRFNLLGAKPSNVGSSSSTEDTVYTSTWLRSGHFMDDPSFAYSTNPSGSDLYVNIVSDTRVVRPCLHLNLTAIMQAVGIASVSEDEGETTLNIYKLNNNVDMIPINIGSSSSVKKERIYKLQKKSHINGIFCMFEIIL